MSECMPFFLSIISANNETKMINRVNPEQLQVSMVHYSYGIHKYIPFNVPNLKLNEVEGKKQYLVEIKNRFTALENLDAEVDINNAWKTNRGYQNSNQKESLL
jgi:hypothetical protein